MGMDIHFELLLKRSAVLNDYGKQYVSKVHSSFPTKEGKEN